MKIKDMRKNNDKTNVMRILGQKKISYISHNYMNTGGVSGAEVAAALGENPDMVFKTLVTVGKSNNHYVFVIPIETEIDFKKAAKAAGEKSVEMLHLKDLTKVTGYVRGGCTSIGMKKQFRTIIDISAKEFTTIIFSAGKIGYQVELSLEQLKKVINFDLADISVVV